MSITVGGRPPDYDGDLPGGVAGLYGGDFAMDRAPLGGVVGAETELMLGQPLLETDGAAGVVGAVAALEDVDPRHGGTVVRNGRG